MAASLFAGVEMAPRDPILGLTEAYIHDARDRKVNLGVGVYLNEEGKVKLCDFGVGRLVGDDPMAPRAGTPRFVAPEVLAVVEAGPRSDIYSLGALALMAMGGRDAEVEDLPAGFGSVIKSALAGEPEMRCSTAGALAVAFCDALESEALRRRTSRKDSRCMVRPSQSVLALSTSTSSGVPSALCNVHSKRPPLVPRRSTMLASVAAGPASEAPSSSRAAGLA